MIKSQVIELHGPRQVVVTTKELDNVPGADALQARTLYSAVSTGTEVAAYTGMPPLRPGPIYPRVVGYCNVAEVTKVGEKVKAYRKGDRILTFQSHRSTFICSETEIITGIAPDADLPAVATTYLFHLGYNALLKGDFRAGCRVAIVGLGFVGLGTSILTTLFGGSAYAFSNQDASLELASAIGATPYRKDEWRAARDAIFQSTHGDGIDLVVVTSNQWSDWRLALELARTGGCICVLGFPGRGEPLPDFNPLDSQFFYDKQLSVVACGYTPDLPTSPQDLRFTVRRNCRFLLDLILSGRIAPHRLITQIRPWHEIDQVYASAAERKQPFLTCILDWISAE